MAPVGKSAVEEKVAAIEAEIRAEVTARQQKGTSAPAVSRTLAVDPVLDLSIEDMEKAIYACLAQADLALEAMNAHMTVEQLVAAKEAEAKAESVAIEAAKAKFEYAMAPTAAK